MHRDAFFSLAYPGWRAATSVKALRPKTRDKLIRKDTTESCVERGAFPAVIEDVLGKRSGTHTRVQHNVPFHHLTVRSSTKPQHIEYEFLPHHHLYLVCHHVITRRTLT